MKLHKIITKKLDFNILNLDVHDPIKEVQNYTSFSNANLL